MIMKTDHENASLEEQLLKEAFLIILLNLRQ